MKIDEYARLIIRKALDRHNKYEVAKMYKIPVFAVELYRLGSDNGTVFGREVIRIEIARKQAEKEGIENFVPRERDRYKKGRN